MAYSEYDIQTSVIPTGTLKVYVEVEALLPDLPLEDTITQIGEIVEGFDVQSGFIQGASTEFTFVEDYNATGGFWKQALAFPTLEIRLTLDEGAGAKDIFWGKVDNVQAFADELDTVSNPTRVGKFSASDILAPRLYATPLADVFDDIIDNTRYDLDAIDSACIRVDELIASMLYVSGLNSSYAASDVTWRSTSEFVCDLSNDDGSTIYTNFPYDDVALYVGWTDDDPSPGTFHLSQTFDSTNANYMPNLIYSAGELLEILAKNLAVIPRRYYDSGRHKVYLECRGIAGAAAAATIDGTMTSSKIYPRLPVACNAVMVSVPSYPTTSQAYVDATGTTTTLSIDAEGRSADIIGQSRFFSDNENPGSAGEYVWHILRPTDDLWYMVWRTGYYDYDAAAQTSRLKKWSEALAEYLYKRLYKGTAYERTYSDASMTVSAVSSITNAFPGQTATVAGSTYYAVQVAKDIYNDTLRVLWFKV